MRKIVFIDMDNVLVDFRSSFKRLDPSVMKEYENDLDEVPGIFSLMDPMPGAVEAVNELRKHYKLYILSTAPWLNSSAWSDKLLWIQKYFGDQEGSIFYKRLILAHHKNLLKGDFLIDDRPNNGASEFEGEWIKFGCGDFKNWEDVSNYLLSKVQIPTA